MRQELIRFYSRAALALLMILLTATTAWANDAVTYIDMNGKTQSVTEYTEVTSGMSLSWATGTYVVKSDVTLSGCIKSTSADIDLIVCDGKTLTVNGGSDGAFWVKTLNIYAQSNGTGVVNVKKKTKCNNLNIAGGTVTLDADGDNYGLFILKGSNIGLTVNGGDVTILNNKNNVGTIYFNGAGFVTQSGGTLTVTNSAGSYNYAIEGNLGTINFNGGTAEINGIIHNCQTINLNGGNVTVNGKIDKDSGYTVTYGFTHATDSYYIQSFGVVYSVYTRTVQVSNGQRLTDGTNIYTGTLTDSQISAISGKTLRQANFTDNGDDTYTIHNAAGWGVFCDLLEGGTSFTGKTIYLNGNIEVSRMAGDSGHKFTGTFNGQGNTLTVSYGTAESPIAEQYAAPFRFVEGGTIENLRVSGDIYTSVKYAAGIIADQYGAVTITNCRSSVTINSSVKDDGTHGGFVAVNHSGDSNSLTIYGCLFDGSLLTTNGTTRCGGFIGWRGCGTNIYNSLFAPAEVTVSTSESATFARNNVDTHNCYYTNAFHDATSYVPGYNEQNAVWRNGKAARSIEPGENVTISDIALTGSETEYNVSGITAYSGGGLALDNGATLYYGRDDAVSLTLSNTADAPLGYQYSGYTVSGGTVTIAPAIATALYLGNGDLTLTRGTLTIKSANYDAILTDIGHTVTVSGGTLSATAGKHAIRAALTMSGGNVTATGGKGAIFDATNVSGGTLTINGNIDGTVTIADGKAFTDAGGHYYTGTLTADEKKAINGQTLTRLTALTLADNASNSAAITKLNGITDLNVTLSGRTLSKNNEWNTLCLPFNVVDGDNTDELTFTGTPLEGATVKELLTSSNLDSNGQLTLNFSDNLTAIEAGKPYIVKWASGDNISNPVFNDVTISSTEPTPVTFSGGSFVGQYSPFEITAGNIDEIIMLSTGNKLGYSQNPRPLRCFRCHFEVPTVAGAPAMNSFVINFGDDESTGISLTPDPSPRGEGSEYYTLDGRKLSGKPTTKGLYIHNGKKVVLH